MRQFFATDYLHHQVRPKNSLHVLEALQAAHPYCWHAVGCDEISVRKDRSEFWVPARLHNAVGSGEADIALAAFCDRHLHSGHRLFHVDSMDANAQNALAIASAGCAVGVLIGIIEGRGLCGARSQGACPGVNIHQQLVVDSVGVALFIVAPALPPHMQIS